MSFIVEQAGKPVPKRALGPVPQRMSFIVEQAGKPVPKQVIEKGARCELS